MRLSKEDRSRKHKHKHFIWSVLTWFLDSDHSLNHKREKFKVLKIELELNHDNVIINLIII